MLVYKDQQYKQVRTAQQQCQRRRGAASVFGIFLVCVIITVTAVTLDLSNISIARSELQRSADASALAACWELYEQKVSAAQRQDLEYGVLQSASELAEANTIAGATPALSQQHDDLSLGRWKNDGLGLRSAFGDQDLNAVRVTLRRESDVNGQVPFYFARVLGREGQSLKVNSTAALLRNIKGFYLPPGTGETLDLLPIALDLQTWNQVLAKATKDQYRVVDGVVTSGCDGIFECSLYPQGTGAPGNRGTVDIGGANNSTNDIARQILSGISAQDMLDLGKPFEFDEEGCLTLNGDTGISAGIKDELASIVGQRRIIPIYEAVTGNGNNATYRIVRFEGVSILSVKLTGSPKQKQLTVQPAPILARGAVIGDVSQEESSYLFTPVMLVE